MSTQVKFMQILKKESIVACSIPHMGKVGAVDHLHPVHNILKEKYNL